MTKPLNIGMIGYGLLRAGGYSRRNGLPIVALGAGLLAIGYGGTFFGNLIKSAVSRQGEYLADASAVQFTRSIDGISGALKKIGSSSGAGSYLGSPSAPEYSHAYFASGISGFWQSMFATHPPLEDRIKRVEPGWDGQYLPSQMQSRVEVAEEAPAPAGGAAGVAVAAAVLSSAEQAISEEHLAEAFGRKVANAHV